MSSEETRIQRLRDRIAQGETTARAQTQSSLDAAEKLNDTLNAFLEIDRVGALKRADAIDAKIKSRAKADEFPSLACVPVAIRDNSCVRGLQNSCGRRIPGPYYPPIGAQCVERFH